MARHVIANTVTATVTLGSPAYAASLLVKSGGSVYPSVAGAAGIYADLTGARLVNDGNIGSSAVGIAVNFAAAGTVINHGFIGSTPAVNYSVPYPNGCSIGVDLAAGGRLVNTGTIEATDVNGSGVVLGAPGTLINQGQLIGGFAFASSLDAGGTAAYLVGGVLVNGGTITGGHGYKGSDGGAGVVIKDAATVMNTGVIAGGQGGYAQYYGPQPNGAGIDLIGGGYIGNRGTIAGNILLGAPGTVANAGVVDGSVVLNGIGVVVNSGSIRGLSLGGSGVGVSLAEAGTVRNVGTIAGSNGYWTVAPWGPPTPSLHVGGDGVDVAAGGTVSNGGTISGGAFGGAGINVSAGGTVVNHGVVVGGSADTYYLSRSGFQYRDGTGIDLSSGGTIVNDGTIVGGAGGTYNLGFESGPYFNSGTGGIGVCIAGGGTLRNAGVITGGAGGYQSGAIGGSGGAGLLVASGTVLNAGTITGGAGFSSTLTASTGGAGGAGVILDGGTLTTSGTIAGGAGGTGTAANGAAGDAIQFGTVASTLVIDPGAVFDGAVVGNASVNDRLALVGQIGTLTGLGTQFLDLSTVAVEAGAKWVLAGANASAATLTVTGVLVDTGISAFTGPTTDTGKIAVAAGTLTLAGGFSGTGAATVAAGAVLDVAGSVTFAGDLTGAGTLLIGGATTLTGDAGLAVAHIVQTADLTLGHLTDLFNPADQDFAIDAASGTTVKLSGAAPDIFSNAGSLLADGAGTADVTVAFYNLGATAADAGTLSFLAPVINNGTMAAAGGMLTFADDVAGRGTLSVSAAGTLFLRAGSDAAQTVQFGTEGGVLALGAALDFDGLVTGYGSGDRIDLIDTHATSYHFASGILTVQDGGATVANLHFGGAYTTADFSLSNDGHGGTMIGFV
jgi:hypothetical protein